MAQFNYKSIRESIARSPSAAKRVNTIMASQFETAKSEFFLEFDNHDVTREIEQGATGDNITNTLGGYGNLFSFIGFEAGDDPIGNLRNALEGITYKTAKSGSVYGDGIIYKYTLVIPREKIKQATEMPWESGRSWAYAIESNISGFSYYLYKHFGKNPPSRSFEAIQAKNRKGKLQKIRDGSFQKIDYLTGLFNNLVAFAAERRGNSANLIQYNR